MAKVEVRKQHALPVEEAAARVRQIADEFVEQYGRLKPRLNWAADGTSGSVEGKGFTARFDVRENEVVITVNLGLLASAAKGTVERTLRERLDAAFG